MRLTTGVARLDELLDGGLPAGSAALAYGPAFMGKELLAKKGVIANITAGRPTIFVLTKETASDAMAQLEELSPGFRDLAAKLLFCIDTYSATIGADEDMPGTQYLEGTLDLNSLSVAVNKCQREIVPHHDNHLIVMDSLSTIVAGGNAQTTFRFLQTFVGRTRLVGATQILLMDEGMHAEAELQMFKHLATGMIRMRDNNGKPQMIVQGLGVAGGQNWVDYRFDGAKFDVTGSFTAGRIR